MSSFYKSPCEKYGGIPLPPTCRTGYFNMQHKYSNMQIIYINMQYNYDDKKHDKSNAR